MSDHDKVTAFQNFWRCAHYPSAITNFFDDRSKCEHLCHTSLLQWYHNGTHLEPVGWSYVSKNQKPAHEAPQYRG